MQGGGAERRTLFQRFLKNETSMRPSKHDKIKSAVRIGAERQKKKKRLDEGKEQCGSGCSICDNLPLYARESM